MGIWRQHPNEQVFISKYLEDELEQGRVISAGTSQEARELGIHCNHFGVIPKNNKPGKLRLIVNL